uniref:Leukemia NUP98 fusion partner 1 n=1 Tax=Strigops habroptila TaxID=2489341 RepID=A0A672THU2_STRHB
MEHEEDDDISFAKWMSSFWGHNLIDENEKEGRGHKKHQTRLLSERRASLPVRAVCSFLCVCGLCMNISAILRVMALEVHEDEYDTPCQVSSVPAGSS